MNLLGTINNVPNINHPTIIQDLLQISAVNFNMNIFKEYFLNMTPVQTKKTRPTFVLRNSLVVKGDVTRWCGGRLSGLISGCPQGADFGPTSGHLSGLVGRNLSTTALPPGFATIRHLTCSQRGHTCGYWKVIVRKWCENR